MASGLGALYSQLGRRLSLGQPAEGLPPILALSDCRREGPTSIPNFFSPHFQTLLDAFLANLAFWQDAIQHCRSTDLKQTLIDHFQVLFLQQLLYPSLLESSDADGSSVAILAYLRCMLESLTDPSLIRLILDYLLAGTKPNDSRSPRTERRRKSLVLHAENEPTPALFSLADLVHASLRSDNVETLNSALKLVSVILSKHYIYATNSLLRTRPASKKQRTVGALSRELDNYLSLAQEIGGEKGMDENYAAYLEDAQEILDSYWGAQSYFSPPDEIPPTSAPIVGQLAVQTPKAVGSHAIVEDDPMMRSLFDLLHNFFSNDVETNLNLTGTIVHIASCPSLQFEGWFTVNPSNYVFEDSKQEDGHNGVEHAGTAPFERLEEEEEEEDSCEEQRFRDFLRAKRLPTWALDDTPLLLAAFKELARELDVHREMIPDLEGLVANRRLAFEASERPDNGKTAYATPPPSSTSRSTTVHTIDAGRASSDGRVTQVVVGNENESASQRIATLQPEPGTSSQSKMIMEAYPDSEAIGKKTSLNHLLTNVVILQEFILEIAALLQLRASLLGEVAFI